MDLKGVQVGQAERPAQTCGADFFCSNGEP